MLYIYTSSLMNGKVGKHATCSDIRFDLIKAAIARMIGDDEPWTSDYRGDVDAEGGPDIWQCEDEEETRVMFYNLSQSDPTGKRYCQQTRVSFHAIVCLKHS